MKASRYNHFLPLDEGRVAAYNARTGSYLATTKHCRDALQAPYLVPDSISLVEALIFKEFGFLIDDAEDELRLIRTRLWASRYDNKQIGLSIAPTMGCNMACTYCYEAGYRVNETMGQDVEEAIIDYVRQSLKDPRPVLISWYGGEPLLVPDKVLRISATLKEMADKANVNFATAMVTNGSLLNQKLVTKLCELKLGSMQITIDGPKEIHDARRKYVSGEGSSFDDIVRNLRDIDFGPIAVAIRCNLDKTNRTAWVQLLHQLHGLGLNKFAAYPGMVMGWGGSCADTSECFDDEEFVPIRWEFDALARQLGFRSEHRPSPRMHYCGADGVSSFAVGPDGSLYKCWNHIGDKSKAVGNILLTHPSVSSPIRDWVHYDPTRDEQCKNCDILPTCLGGCPEKAATSADGRRVCDFWRLSMRHSLKMWAQDWLRKVGSHDRLSSVSS